MGSLCCQGRNVYIILEYSLIHLSQLLTVIGLEASDGFNIFKWSISFYRAMDRPSQKTLDYGNFLPRVGAGNWCYNEPACWIIKPVLLIITVGSCLNIGAGVFFRLTWINWTLCMQKRHFITELQPVHYCNKLHLGLSFFLLWKRQVEQTVADVCCQV